MSPRKACLSLLAASALAFVLAAPQVRAQPYDSDDGYYYARSGDEVIIRPRPYSEGRGWTGAPIETVSLSRVVRYDDLDLRSDRDAHILKVRVHRAAYDACQDLDRLYPATTSDSPPCRADAERRGLREANDAIEQARSW